MLYICWSYYHVMIALIEVMVKKIKADILLIQKNEILSRDLENRLRDINVFRKVYYVEEEKAPWGVSKKNIIKYIFQRYFQLTRYYNCILPIKWREYSKIITFFDADSIGAYLNISQIYYELYEDSKHAFSIDTVQNLPNTLRRYIEPNFFISIMQCVKFYVPIFGCSQYCTAIHVGSGDQLFINNKTREKFHIVSRENWFFKLNESQKDLLTSVFYEGYEYISSINSFILVLTEPLCNEGRVKNIKQQVAVYRNLIERLGNNVAVVIKPHPRDVCNYSGLISKSVTVLPKTFPSEILAFILGEKIEKCYSVTSNSVLSFSQDKAVVLGKKFIEQCINIEGEL